MTKDPECKRCIDNVATPRSILALPPEVTQHEDFNKPELPVLLCQVCDGEAYALATATHEARTQK